MKKTKINGILASVITVSMILTGCNATTVPEAGSNEIAETPAVEETSAQESVKTEETSIAETEKSEESDEANIKESYSDSEKTETEKTDSGEADAAEAGNMDEWLENELTRIREGGPLEKAFEPGNLKTKDVPIYYNSAESKENISLAFFDPDESVPYISLEDVST